MVKNNRALYNIVTNLCLQIITALSGFIIPKLILTSYGSTMNGMVNSISQFLTYAALVEMGVGNASVAALYKPIAENNIDNINAILMKTKQKYLVSGIIYTIISCVIAIVYPLSVRTQVGYETASVMTFILAINGVIDYVIIGKYKAFLIAEEKTYIINIIKGGSTVVLTVISVSLLLEGCTLYTLKLSAAFIHLIEAFLIKNYVRMQYKSITFCSSKKIELEQQSSALLHQICVTITYNTDLAVLTMFLTTGTSLREISVYTVYMLVRTMVNSLGAVLTNGINATFGAMFAKKEFEKIKDTFKFYEFIYFIYIFILYSSMMSLLLPFVRCYTRNIVDARYVRIELAVLFAIVGVLAQLKDASGAIITAAGHFKQTCRYAITEAIINITVSIILVRILGIVGVLIGTIVSHIFMDISYMRYASKKLIQGTGITTTKRILRNAIIMTLLCGVELFYIPVIADWNKWIIEALIVAIVNISVIVLVNCLCEKEQLKRAVCQIIRLMRRI